MGDQVRSAIAYAMQGDFKAELQALLERHNSTDVDRIAQLTARVQHINDNVIESIDKILRRQEKIDLLVNRSEMLSDSSSSFQRAAHAYNEQQIWWKDKRKLGLVLALIAIGI